MGRICWRIRLVWYGRPKEADVRLNRWVSVLAGLLALSTPVGGALAQSDEDKAAARSLAKEGIDAYGNGKHAEALDLLSRAEAIFHAPPHVLYIARSQAALGKLVAARESYLKVMREDLPASAPKAFKDAQQQAKEEAAAIEPRIASLRINLEGAGGAKVSVKLDGQPVSAALIGVYRPTDPGKHTVTAYPPGRSPVEQSVELADGEKKEVKLALSGAGAPGTGIPQSSVDDPDAGQGGPKTGPDKKTGGGLNTLMIVGIAGLGVGLGGVVVGAIFTAKFGSKSAAADSKFIEYGCNQKPNVGPACTPARQAEIDGLDGDAATSGTIGVIGLAAGGVLLAGGATALVLGLGQAKKAKAEQEHKTVWITPWVSPSGFGVSGAF